MILLIFIRKNKNPEAHASGFFLSFFHYLRCVADLVHGVDRHERFRVDTADEVHQLAVLVLINDRDNLAAGRVIVRSRDLVESRSTVEIVKNEVYNLIKLRRDDAHSSLDVEAEDKVINHDSAEIRTEYAEHHGLRVI